jgi:hypothetical protein
MRQLATIQKIKTLEPIQNADSIEKATILGWHVVVKKGEFKVGDLCIYCEIDSVMPEREEFEFLRPRKFKIKTMKLRGQVSQGICFPLTILPEGFAGQVKEGTDCTDALGITKYEPPTPNFLSQKQATRLIFPKWMPSFLIQFIRRFPKLSEKFRKPIPAMTWPQFLTKTDETRVQILQGVLDKYCGTKCYVTEKLDGSSVTYFLKDGKFGVCSRNLELPKDEANGFWKAAIESDIENKLRQSGMKNVAIQGELIGTGIQGNKYGLSGLEVWFFQVFDIDKQEYLSLYDFTWLMNVLELKHVPIISANYTLCNSVDELVELSKGKSALAKVPREGIVIRPVKEVQDFDFNSLHRSRLSFKVINPDFLLKYED